jgi:aspartate-semialdehyde dehydrogenase
LAVYLKRDETREKEMAIKTVGIVGWRGMVGSVLMERMQAEGDFTDVEPVFFSTSQVGAPGPDVGRGSAPLRDANDISAFRDIDVVITCQGGDYTKQVHPQLRQAGFNGYWIDAASALRMADNSVIILDPVNRSHIDSALERGIKDYVGGNCTVSLMLMAIGGLFEQGWVEWVNSSTYQAASGAGAKNMRELIAQMKVLGDTCAAQLNDPATNILELDRTTKAALSSDGFPKSEFGAPLAASLIPWIDSAVEGGQTREEWKGFAETNKILQTARPIPVDGTCVRVGAMRCHSQALTIKLTNDVPLDEVTDVIARANSWVRVVPNDRASTLAQLSPAVVSGTLDVPIGRLRKMKMGGEFLSAFTVGDQLLWGAAEPLRRMLRILVERG